MKRISTLTALAVGLGTLCGAHAKTLYYEDFSLRLPKGVTTADRDGLQPSIEMGERGFKAGSGWIWDYDQSENNGVASAMSWYAQAGTSDDWMILAPLTLDADSPVLSWRSRSCNKKIREGFKVYVVEGEATSPEQLEKAAPLFNEIAEAAQWTAHELDLSAYKGKTVTIAFRDDTFDSGQLYVDDIYVGSKLDFTVACTAGAFSGLAGEREVTGIFHNSGDKPVNGFTVMLTSGGESREVSVKESVAPGADMAFSAGTVTCVDGEVTPYILSVEAAGQTAEYSHEMQTELHRLYVEEGTGTWCGWCVGGIVMVERLEEKYPDNFVPVVVHANDVMTSNEYLGEMQKNFSFASFPCCVSDRSAEGSALDMPKMMEQSVNSNFEPLGLKVRGVFTDEYKSAVRATVTARFARSFQNSDRYRVCVVMTEDSVHLPKAEYNQSNSYSGSEEDWDGWEKKPGTIPAIEMWYRHVARVLLTPFQGEHSSLPDYIEGGETYEFNVEAEVPKAVIVRDNIRLCALVIDSRTGRAVNAAMTTMNADDTSVETIGTDSRPEVEEWYDLSGRKVVNPGPGIYITRHAGGTIRKVVR